MAGVTSRFRKLARSSAENEAQLSTLTERESARVLVVEKGHGCRHLFTGLNARLALEGMFLEEGVTALDLMRSADFDVVLLDLELPDVDGFQILGQIKADSQLRDVPVIAMSSDDKQSTLVRCIRLGAEDHLVKPVNQIIFEARMRSCLIRKRQHEQAMRHFELMKDEKRRADELLQVIMPAEIVKELKESDSAKPRRHEGVAVLFSDIASFTRFSDANSPEMVADNLQRLIEAQEEATIHHQVEKIKTIGDAFMAAAGLVTQADNPVLDCVRCALDMQRSCHELGIGWQLRIGIAYGPAMAGIIGKSKFFYDIWGDTVNTASRLQHVAPKGGMVANRSAWEQVAEACEGERLPDVDLKGKGVLAIYRIDGLKREETTRFDTDNDLLTTEDVKNIIEAEEGGYDLP